MNAAGWYAHPLSRHRRVLAGAVLVAAVLAAPLALVAKPGLWQVRPADSTVSFTIMKWMVFREEGRFRDFRGAITYDPQRPQAAQVEFTVFAASIDTNNATRDQVLRSDDFFDVAAYPTLTFRSTSVQPAGEGELSVTGDLTIRGISRRVTLPVRVLGTNRVEGMGHIAGFETGFTLDRTDFGVNGTRWSGGRMILGREVNVQLRVAAQQR